jgi:hypothetical protein
LRPQSTLFSQPYFNKGFVVSAIRGKGRGAFMIVFESWKDAEFQADDSETTVPSEWVSLPQILSYFAFLKVAVPLHIVSALEQYDIATTSVVLVVVRPSSKHMVFHVEPYYYMPVIDDVNESGFYRLMLGRCNTCKAVLSCDEIANPNCLRCDVCRCVLFCSAQCKAWNGFNRVALKFDSKLVLSPPHLPRQCPGPLYQFVEQTMQCDPVLEQLKEYYGLSTDAYLDPLQSIYSMIRYAKQKARGSNVSFAVAAATSSGAPTSVRPAHILPPKRSTQKVHDRRYFERILNGGSGSNDDDENDDSDKSDHDESKDDYADGDSASYNSASGNMSHSSMTLSLNSLEVDPEKMLSFMFSHMQGRKNIIDLKLDELTMEQKRRKDYLDQFSSRTNTMSQAASSSASRRSTQMAHILPDIPQKKPARKRASKTSTTDVSLEKPVSAAPKRTYTKRLKPSLTQQQQQQQHTSAARTRSSNAVGSNKADESQSFSFIKYCESILVAIIETLHDRLATAGQPLLSELFRSKVFYEQMLQDLKTYVMD